MESRSGPRRSAGAAKSPRSFLKHSLALQAEELKRNLHKPVGSARVALRQELTLSFPHFQSFLTEYSSNLSMTGMFVRSETCPAPGTLVDFELRLVDGLRLIHGRAEVVWVRENRGDPNRPPGMSLRFLRLDAQSRRLIRWLVEKHVAEEGSLVDFKDFLRASRPDPALRDLDLHKLYPYARVAVARGEESGAKRRRRRRHGLLAATALVTLSACGILLGTRGGGMISRKVEASPAPAINAPVAPAERVGDPQPEGLFETVEAWIRESSGGHFEEFLGFDRLREANGRGIRPHSFKLETSVEAEFPAPDRARVSFARHHLSDGGRETVVTTLDLALEDGRWTILDEVTRQGGAAADREAAPTAPRVGRIEVLKPLSLRRGRPSVSVPRARMIPPGTVLEYVGWTPGGETVDGNSHWYEDADGNYFWAGGTAAPAPGSEPGSG